MSNLHVSSGLSVNDNILVFFFFFFCFKCNPGSQICQSSMPHVAAKAVIWGFHLKQYINTKLIQHFCLIPTLFQWEPNCLLCTVDFNTCHEVTSKPAFSSFGNRMVSRLLHGETIKSLELVCLGSISVFRGWV